MAGRAAGLSLADDNPAPGWRRAAAILGALNLLVGIPILVLGCIIDDDATPLIVIGGTQTLIGVADVVLAVMSGSKSGARRQPRHAALRIGPLATSDPAQHAVYGARIGADF